MPENLPARQEQTPGGNRANPEEQDNTLRFAERLFNWFGEAAESRDAQIREQQGKAAKRMEKLKFGGSILGAGLLMALAGTIALPFWGIKKILQADKDFMRFIGGVKG